MEKDILSDIAKRPEKLASAVYLVTSFFNDLEPMKWKLRSLVSDSVSVANSLKDDFSSDKQASLLKIRGIASEISELLTVANNSALISKENANLLRSEFDKYLGLVEGPLGIENRGQGAVLSKEFFLYEPATKHTSLPKPAENTETSTKRTEKTDSEGLLPSAENVKRQISNTPSSSQDSKSDSSQKETDGKKSLKEFGAVSVKRNARQSIIIGLIKRKKEVMIKDVTPHIKGCSDKTVQRELLRMVKAGILKKEGEKRWSTYSLAPGYDND